MLGGFDFLVDWHPWAGKFHLSAGVFTFRGPWKLAAASASSYTINGVRYAVRDVGSLSGETEFGNAIAPTILFGWGNPVRPGKKWGFVSDFGLSFTGGQDFRLRASGPIASDPAFARDLAAEQDFHSSDSSVWPIIRIGFFYQF